VNVGTLLSKTSFRSIPSNDDEGKAKSIRRHMYRQKRKESPVEIIEKDLIDPLRNKHRFNK